MSFLSNLFADKKLQQVNKQRQAINIKGFGKLNPQWIALSNKNDFLSAYYSISPLFNVINYEANAFSRLTFKHYKRLGNDKYKEIKNSPLIDKLDNPNPIQNGKEWLIQLYIFWQVFGTNIIFNNSLTNDYNQILNLWNLPFQNITLQLTDKFWAATDLKEIIKSIKDINQQNYPVEQCIMLNDSNIDFKNDRYVIGKSKMLGVQKSISNIAANLTTRNIFLEKRGAVGILSNDSSDDAGTIPLDPIERENLQNDFYNNYGTLSKSQYQIIISDAKLKWQSMSYPIKDMMLEEQFKRDKIEICDAYSFPIPLLNEFDSAAGQANMQHFEKMLYVNKILPDGKMLESSLNKYFNLVEKNEYLEICFDDIEVLEKDKKTKLETAKLESDIILNLQKSVKDGSTSEQSAINILSSLLSYDIEEATQLLSFEQIKVLENVN